MRKILAALVASATLLTLGACGSPEPQTKESLAEQTGCKTLTEEATEELFVRELFACDSGLQVYTFNNTDGRDQWLEVAETFGVVVIAKGDDWLKVEE